MHLVLLAHERQKVLDFFVLFRAIPYYKFRTKPVISDLMERRGSPEILWDQCLNPMLQIAALFLAREIDCAGT